MKPEERLAILKELVKFKPQSINETKRAKALLRSLQQGRGIERRQRVGEFTGTTHNMTNRRLPAIGRSVMSNTMTGPNYKTPLSSVDFFSNDNGGMGLGNKPFKGGLKDSKSKALKFQLGKFFEELPTNSRIKISSTDSRRSNAYDRMTKGALKFQPFEKTLPLEGGEANSYVTKKGNIQPRVNNKFTKAVPNPAEALQQPLRDAATAVTPVIRRLPALQRFIRSNPYMSAILMGLDAGQFVRDRTPPDAPPFKTGRY